MAKLKKDYEFPLYLFHSGKNYKAYEYVPKAAQSI